MDQMTPSLNVPSKPHSSPFEVLIAPSAALRSAHISFLLRPSASAHFPCPVSLVCVGLPLTLGIVSALRLDPRECNASADTALFSFSPWILFNHSGYEYGGLIVPSWLGFVGGPWLLAFLEWKCPAFFLGNGLRCLNLQEDPLG